MPIDVMYGTPSAIPTTHSEYAAKLKASLERAYELVREHMGRRLERQTEVYNRKIHGDPFKTGDLVWLHSPAVRRDQSKKLHRPWTGPFKVVGQLSETTYRIQNTRVRRQQLVVHFNRLKLCPQTTHFSSPNRSCPHLQPPSPQPSTPQFNGQLELVDDDDSAAPLPPPPQQIASLRYPRRHWHPPNYFEPQVRHWPKIRDEFFEDGGYVASLILYHLPIPILSLPIPILVMYSLLVVQTLAVILIL